jgi:hypothetical protein
LPFGYFVSFPNGSAKIQTFSYTANICENILLFLFV